MLCSSRLHVWSNYRRSSSSHHGVQCRPRSMHGYMRNSWFVRSNSLREVRIIQMGCSEIDILSSALCFSVTIVPFFAYVVTCILYDLLCQPQITIVLT